MATLSNAQDVAVSGTGEKRFLPQGLRATRAVGGCLVSGAKAMHCNIG